MSLGCMAVSWTGETGWLYHCRIRPEHIPDFVDPLAFAEKRRRIQGSLPLAVLDRLRDELLETEGVTEFVLNFDREGRMTVVSGNVQAELVLQCQCCLGPLVWPVKSDIRLGVVGSIDEANVLPDSIEPLLLNPGETVAVADLLQDELLLSIPVVPRHSNCLVSGKDSSLSDAQTDKKRNPFAELAKLQKNRT